jgi:hypothetical protein
VREKALTIVGAKKEKGRKTIPSKPSKQPTFVVDGGRIFHDHLEEAQGI